MSHIINLKTKKEVWTERQTKDKKRKEKPETEKNSEKIGVDVKNKYPQVLEWSTLEFTKHQKDPLWFIIGGIIAVVLLIIAVLAANFIFVLVIILSAFLIYIWAQKEPKKYNFKIAPKGIIINNTIYGFNDLKSFWIFYDPPEIKYLSIESKKLMMPRMVIPIDNEDPNKIREALIEFLPEKEQEESLIDVLGRYLRY